MRVYRRVEAFLGGSPTRKGEIRSITLEPKTKPEAKGLDMDRTRPNRVENPPPVPEVERKRE